MQLSGSSWVAMHRHRRPLSIRTSSHKADTLDRCQLSTHGQDFRICTNVPFEGRRFVLTVVVSFSMNNRRPPKLPSTTWVVSVVNAQSIDDAQVRNEKTWSLQSKPASTDRARLNSISLHLTVDGAKLLVTARMCSWHAMITTVVIESGPGFSDKFAAIVCTRCSAS